MPSRKKAALALVCLFAASAGLAFFLARTDTGCGFKKEAIVIRGGSLEPLAHDGDKARLLRGYYPCHEIRRGDIVAYNHPAEPVPIAKIAKGIPGDSLELLEIQKNSQWRIVLNGEVLLNSNKEPYVVDWKAHGLLSLYITDYKGKIPPGAYLLLGNLATGSLDSRNFGLVDQGDIAGKIVL